MIRLNINHHENIIDGIHDLSSNLTLDQNYPNPFIGSTLINYSLEINSNVSIEIKDLTGRVVNNIDLGNQPPGQHSFEFESQNLESGIYIYTLFTDYGSQTKKMILSR